MTANLRNSFSDKPAPVAITVAEIKGSELPDERVIVGGHLDSWDLGQGALDNGTGAMAVLEAARTLHALGWKPKRTVTFVLFTGEEQGGIGADTYVKNHASELAKTDAVLVLDTGTGKVYSIALENLWETGPLMSEIYQPLQEVFDLQPLSTRYFGASDHVEFLDKGVPAYFCMQVPAQYRQAHHSQTDTFDKVIPDQINQGAALLAAWAWNVSEMPPPLPHHEAKASGGIATGSLSRSHVTRVLSQRPLKGASFLARRGYFCLFSVRAPAADCHSSLKSRTVWLSYFYTSVFVFQYWLYDLYDIFMY